MKTSKRLVFAHYFPPYPISIDNVTANSDYYATQYLNPDGEAGAHRYVGGFLRDRPLPRPVSSDARWRQLDLETEVRQAIDAGIDGFTVDILTVASNPLWTSPVPANLLAAAAAVSPSFKIMLMPDMSGQLGTLNAADLAAELSRYAPASSAFRLADRRLVISPFLAERHDPGWWTNFMQIMSSRYGINVAFVPVFLDSVPNLVSYAPISYGMSNWGGRNPAFNPVSVTSAGTPLSEANRAHSLGKLWMQPVSFQDERPSQSIFDEAGATENLRNSWQNARDSGSEWVQLISWNDYSEGTSFAPSAGHGKALLDLNMYLVYAFKLQRLPDIIRDTAYVTYRSQLSTAQPQFRSQSPMVLRRGSTPVRNVVEVVTLLVGSADVVVTIGGVSTTCKVGAGPGICVVPARVGAISVRVVRNGANVVTLNAHRSIEANPFVQNLEYMVDSSRR